MNRAVPLDCSAPGSVVVTISTVSSCLGLMLRSAKAPQAIQEKVETLSRTCKMQVKSVAQTRSFLGARPYTTRLDRRKLDIARLRPGRKNVMQKTLRNGCSCVATDDEHEWEITQNRSQ